MFIQKIRKKERRKERKKERKSKERKKERKKERRVITLLLIIKFSLGSKDVMNGEEYDPEYEGYDGPRDANRLRPKKHKTKKPPR